jgi:hypothetical protein
MKRFLKKMLASWTKAKKRPSATAAKRTARLGIEQLEERTVPTVFFKPAFPGLTFSGTDWHGNKLDPTKAALQSPKVYFIFANSSTSSSTNWDWSTGAGLLDEKVLLHAAQDILSNAANSYLSKLQQYGYDNNASVAGSWIDPQAFPLIPGQSPSDTYPFDSKNNPDTNSAALESYLFGANGAISRRGITDPSTGNAPVGTDDRDLPLFVIVTAPNDSVLAGGQGAGFNTFAPTKNQGAIAIVETEFRTNNPSSGIWMDEFTDTFSHEIVEAISHELVVDFPVNEQGINGIPLPGANNPAEARDQIADGEPGRGPLNSVGGPVPGVGNYTARLASGELVQAYWSAGDVDPITGAMGTYIIPDGNNQLTFENPKWSAGIPATPPNPSNSTPGWITPPAFQRLTEVFSRHVTGIESLTHVPKPAGLPFIDDLTVEFHVPFPNSPGLFGGTRFYHARTDGDGNIFVAMSLDNVTYLPDVQIVTPDPSNPNQTIPELALDNRNPALAVFDNKLFIAWTGRDNNLNVATVNLSSSTGNPTGFLRGKQTLGYTSDEAPALVSFHGALFLAHAGRFPIDGVDDPLVLDFINPSNPTFSHALNLGGERTKSPPALFNDKIDDKLVVAWKGTDGKEVFAFANLTDDTGAPLVSLPPEVNGVLTIDGYQDAGMNDNIVLDRNSSGGLHVTLNGIVTDYAPGTLSQIVIDTGTGTNTIAVHTVDQNVPVTINALGHTAVNVGDNGSMISIQGASTSGVPTTRSISRWTPPETVQRSSSSRAKTASRP